MIACDISFKNLILVRNISDGRALEADGQNLVWSQLVFEKSVNLIASLEVDHFSKLQSNYSIIHRQSSLLHSLWHNLQH